MSPEVIKQMTDRGWSQSHTATAKGCVFERLVDTELVVRVVNGVGVTRSECEFDMWAVGAGVASAAVELMHKKLNEG